MNIGAAGGGLRPGDDEAATVQRGDIRLVFRETGRRPGHAQALFHRAAGGTRIVNLMSVSAPLNVSV